MKRICKKISGLVIMGLVLNGCSIQPVKKETYEENKTQVNSSKAIITKESPQISNSSMEMSESNSSIGNSKNESNTSNESNRVIDNKSNGLVLENLQKKPQGSLKDNSYYIKLDNTQKPWSHGYPEDLTAYNGHYSLGKGNIALTFDLGYEAGYTEKFLDILKEKNVKATFFLTGTYIKENKALTDRIRKEGHVIGVHGYNHDSMNVLSENGYEAMVEDLKKWEKEAGFDADLYRAPSGHYSLRGMEILKDMGYKNIFWGLAYKDWEENSQPDPVSSLEKLKKDTVDGDIVLLHVFKTNEKILGDYIDWLREKGYNIIQPVNRK